MTLHWFPKFEERAVAGHNELVPPNVHVRRSNLAIRATEEQASSESICTCGCAKNAVPALRSPSHSSKRSITSRGKCADDQEQTGLRASFRAAARHGRKSVGRRSCADSECAARQARRHLLQQGHSPSSSTREEAAEQRDDTDESAEG